MECKCVILMPNVFRITAEDQDYYEDISDVLPVQVPAETGTELKTKDNLEEMAVNSFPSKPLTKEVPFRIVC
jgi:hypothetical protein